MSRTGPRGEELAADHLTEKGYRIVERNWRPGNWGELDIVAYDDGTLVFVEVKTARSKKFGDPLQWITKRKQRQLAALAGAYLAYGEEADAVRFDVVTVDMSRLPPAIMHMEDAFRPDGR